MLRRFLGLTVLCGIFVFTGCKSPPRQVPTGPRLDDFARVQNVHSFNELLEIMQRRLVVPPEPAPDWDAIDDSYEPRILVAPTMYTARDLMRDALDEANLPNCVLLPREMFALRDGPADGAPGFELRIVDNAAVVSTVLPRTPAEGANIQPGWELLSIDAVDVRRWIRYARAGGPDTARTNLLLIQRLSERLNGPRESTVALRFVDHEARQHAFALERARPWGKRVHVGELPPEYVYAREDTLSDDVGYIKLSALLDAAEHVPLVEQTLRRFNERGGVVLDLRGCSTGVPSIAADIAGLVLNPPAAESLGTFKTRLVTTDARLEPTDWHYTGPLAILVDDCTASSAELLTAALQQRGKARVFGSATAGSALPSVFRSLPNGDHIHYPAAAYRLAAGDLLEGVGIDPDVKLTQTRAALLKQEDRTLQAAADWVRAQPRPQPGAATKPPTDTPEAKAAKIIEASIEAMGGRAAFERLTTRIVDGKLDIVPHGLKGTWQVYKTAPNLQYEKVTIAGLGTRAEGTDGEVYWTVTPKGEPIVYSDADLALRKRKTRFNSQLPWRELYPQTRYLGTEVAEGHKCDKVEFVPDVGDPHIVYYDQETKLPYKHVAQVTTAAGEQVVETISEDYRDVDGILLAHLTIVRIVGVVGEQRAQVLRVAHNVEIPESRFELPDVVQALLAGDYAPPETQPTTQPADPTAP
jgi:C-terminal processing protease CtpA/Prc